MQETLLYGYDIKATIDPEDYSKLESYAKRDGVSVSAILTIAIEKMIKSEETARRVKPPKKTHYRLEQYLEAYEKKKGLKYLIGDYASHCGAAARTVSKVSDSEWLKIIDLYLDSNQERVKQAGHPFHWLIHDLNRWFRESNAQKSVGWAQKLKDIIKGK